MPQFLWLNIFWFGVAALAAVAIVHVALESHRRRRKIAFIYGHFSLYCIQSLTFFHSKWLFAVSWLQLPFLYMLRFRSILLTVHRYRSVCLKTISNQRQGKFYQRKYMNTYTALYRLFSHRFSFIHSHKSYSIEFNVVWCSCGGTNYVLERDIYVEFELMKE